MSKNTHQNNSNLYRSIILFCTIILATLSANAQSENLEKNILEKDSIFWNAYNACDIETMNNYLATDIEFYHDKGGIELGSEALNRGLKKGLCQSGKNNLRREAIPESIAVFPLKDNEVVYGAILSGEHLFYTKNKNTDTLDGQAKFNHLWLLKDGEWKMHRVLSYDHRAPEYKRKNKQVSLSSSELLKLAGNYELPSKDLVTVKVTEDHLELNAMGKDFEIFPENALTFFSKERDLKFLFSEGTPRKLKILEAGNLVAEAVYINK